jgi:hypothetical protein
LEGVIHIQAIIIRSDDKRFETIEERPGFLERRVEPIYNEILGSTPHIQPKVSPSKA